MSIYHLNSVQVDIHAIRTDKSFAKVDTMCPICGFMSDYFIDYFMDEIPEGTKQLSNHTLYNEGRSVVASKLSKSHIAYDKENRHKVDQIIDLDSYAVYMRPVAIHIIDKDVELPLPKKEEIEGLVKKLFAN